MPRKKTHGVFQTRPQGNRIQEYYYIKYTLSVLRVIAWIVLALGIIGSLVWGVTVGGIGGGGRIAIGIIASFLAWLLLLAARELLKLFMDVKENTGSTAERITKEPD
jgi:small-conductance mechanosensitive channel